MNAREVGSPPREDDLFARCRHGDADAREQLVAHFAPLATRLARRYVHSGEPLDDLEQVALIGLIKAIDGFKPARGAFRPYALPVILGELRHHFRDHTWVLHVPSHMRELTQRVSRATATLSEQLRREPSVLEIAAEIGASDEDVLDARAASGARRTLSFGTTRGATGDPYADAMTIGDGVMVLEEGYARAEDRAMLESMLLTLTARQRTILSLRFEHDLTQTQIASVIGISQMHVSRVLRDGLARMRAIGGVEDNVRRLPSVQRGTAKLPGTRAATG
ncbi:MAG: polymerase sigma-B factor [bacterium]|jgi:RNA polymerase sigma-B factor